jgi:hypothetical protein
MLGHLSAPRSLSLPSTLLHTGGCIDWRIVPVEPPQLLRHGGLLLLQVLQEFAQSLDGIGGIGGGAPGDNVLLGESVRVSKCHDHLFGMLAWTHAFEGPCWPLGIHCLLKVTMQSSMDWTGSGWR